eukprot:6525527-Pyramimonas_sp.AAC.1
MALLTVVSARYFAQLGLKAYMSMAVLSAGAYEKYWLFLQYLYTVHKYLLSQLDQFYKYRTLSACGGLCLQYAVGVVGSLMLVALWDGEQLTLKTYETLNLG